MSDTFDSEDENKEGGSGKMKKNLFLLFAALAAAVAVILPASAAIGPNGNGIVANVRVQQDGTARINTRVQCHDTVAFTIRVELASNESVVPHIDGGYRECTNGESLFITTTPKLESATEYKIASALVQLGEETHVRHRFNTSNVGQDSPYGVKFNQSWAKFGEPVTTPAPTTTEAPVVTTTPIETEITETAPQVTAPAVEAQQTLDEQIQQVAQENAAALNEFNLPNQQQPTTTTTQPDVYWGVGSDQADTATGSFPSTTTVPEFDSPSGNSIGGGTAIAPGTTLIPVRTRVQPALPVRSHISESSASPLTGRYSQHGENFIIEGTCDRDGSDLQLVVVLDAHLESDTTEFFSPECRTGTYRTEINPGSTFGGVKKSAKSVTVNQGSDSVSVTIPEHQFDLTSPEQVQSQLTGRYSENGENFVVRGQCDVEQIDFQVVVTLDVSRDPDITRTFSFKCRTGEYRVEINPGSSYINGIKNRAKVIGVTQGSDFIQVEIPTED